MSMDYPFYEQLCRRGHRAAWWWLVGDRLYYLGLVAAALGFCGGVVAPLAWLLGQPWAGFAVLAAGFPAGAVVWWVGGTLKIRAYRLAKRDGIEP